MSEHPKSQLLPHLHQTVYVFAARYTHDRPTGGALAITRALREVWDRLSEQTQAQILDESTHATACRDDWQRFREWVGVLGSDLGGEIDFLADELGN